MGDVNLKFRTCNICGNELPPKFIWKLGRDYCICDRCLAEYESAHTFIERIYADDEPKDMDTDNKPKLEA